MQPLTSTPQRYRLVLTVAGCGAEPFAEGRGDGEEGGRCIGICWHPTAPVQAEAGGNGSTPNLPSPLQTQQICPRRPTDP